MYRRKRGKCALCHNTVKCLWRALRCHLDAPSRNSAPFRHKRSRSAYVVDTNQEIAEAPIPSPSRMQKAPRNIFFQSLHAPSELTCAPSAHASCFEHGTRHKTKVGQSRFPSILSRASGHRASDVVTALRIHAC